MVLAAWPPSGAALSSRHERTLSQVSFARPDMTLDVVRMGNILPRAGFETAFLTIPGSSMQPTSQP